MSDPTIIVYGINGASIVRILFSNPMKNNDALVNASNYTIYPDDVGVSVPISYKEVTPENKEYPTYIDITCTEMTIGKTYNLEVNTGTDGPVDFEDNHIDSGTGIKTFSGTGRQPYIISVAALSKNQCKITFSEVMDNNLDIKNPAKYSFDNGLTVQSVLSVDGAEVILKTSDQDEGTLYQLTLSLT